MAESAGSPLTPEQLAEVEVIGKLVVKTDSANAPLAAGVLALVADVRYWKAMHDQQVHLKRGLHDRYEGSRLECERARALAYEMLATFTERGSIGSIDNSLRSRWQAVQRVRDWRDRLDARAAVEEVQSQ